ncbi:MAG: hypothetical protein NTY14_00940 [Candidatus Omnitrophica bacterium]|nr:hypothetical protein [Candidatus Omnitrophota bacterium]
MNKKLIVIMILALVVGVTAAAFAEVQNVKVSGSMTAVGLSRESLNFQKGLNAETSANNEFASISKIDIGANLTDNVDVNFRLLNERAWAATGNTGTNTSTNEIDLALAYITLKEFMKETISVPLNLIVGRQVIKIGSGLMVGANGTNQNNTTQLPPGAGDFSTRVSFDGIVGVWDLTPEFTVISGFVKATEAAVTAGKDTDVYIVDGSYKLGENAMSTVLEGTYVAARTVRGNVNNYGGRATLVPVENLNVEGEYVYQVSNAFRNRASDAIRLGANFAMPDVTWKPGFGVDYMRLSNRWNKLHESLSPADLANLIFDNTNLSVVGATVSAKPMDDLKLKLRYANLNLTKKIADNGTTYTSTALGAYTTNANKKALGYEIDAGLAYDYTSDVQLGLNYGVLKPGKVFTAKKAASQVLGSMKVSF